MKRAIVLRSILIVCLFFLLSGCAGSGFKITEDVKEKLHSLADGLTQTASTAIANTATNVANGAIEKFQAGETIHGEDYQRWAIEGLVTAVLGGLIFRERSKRKKLEGRVTDEQREFGVN